MDGEAEGREIRHGCRLDAGQLFQPGQQLPVKLESCFVGIAHGIEIVGGQIHIVLIEARIGLLGFLKAANKKSGTGQQQERQRNLRHHETAGET
jgi:hypothetical protein